MANIKVSEMPLATSVTPEDLIMLIQGGGNKKVTTNTLLGDSVIVSPTEPVGNDRRKVWFRKGKNKFNPNDKTNGYLNIDGNFTSATDWTCSGFIEINSNKYILSANTTARRVIWCEYDGSMNIIGTRHEVAYGNPIAIVSVNTKYIRVCFNDGTATDIQLEQGTTATTYEPYVEDKIYIKNNNDVYEEFIKKQEEVYSTEEVKIGTWIDGKPLYRKVINATPTISNSSYQTISIKHNISDLKNIHKCNAFLHNTGNTRTYILPAETSATKAIGISEINSTNIIMYSKNDAWSGWIAEIILEYTKTTD